MRPIRDGSANRKLTLKERLKLFDDATERQRHREAARSPVVTEPRNDRGWTRQELYQSEFKDRSVS